jgi:hypothetical protein
MKWDQNMERDANPLRLSPPLSLLLPGPSTAEIPLRTGLIKSTKGPIGLTTVYNPPDDIVVDLIFVHGVNGGSQSTWTKNGDPSLFWPQEWLPKDQAFHDVRIHTFGYASAISQGSVLNIPDFARSLLYSIHDSPVILRESKVGI